MGGGEGGGVAGRIDLIETTIDFFSHFLSWNSTLFRINAVLLSILSIAPIFVFKTRIAGLTPFNLQR